MSPSVKNSKSPLDLLLSPLNKGFVASPVAALKASWHAAREALETGHPPVRAFAELALGEILSESGRIARDSAGGQARETFQIHNGILSAAAFLRMALAEGEVGIGSNRKKAFRAIEHLLENTALPADPDKGAIKDFADSCRTLGKALLETQVKILHTLERPWQERRSNDAQLQAYVARLDTVASFKRSMRGTALLRSLLLPENATERMYSAALAQVTNLPYTVHNIGPLLRDNFSTAEREWKPGAAPLVVAAEFSKALNSNDRIVATTVKIPRRGTNELLGDIDLLVSVNRGKAARVSPKLIALEVKYGRVSKRLLDRNQRAVENAIAQSRTIKEELAGYSTPVESGIVLFDSQPERTPIQKLRGVRDDIDFFQVHPSNACPKLTLSDKLLTMILAQESSLDTIIQSLKPQESAPAKRMLA